MKAKQHARDVQDRTGWSYQFCRRIVDQLRYEYVSEQLDAAEVAGESVEQVGRRLNAELQRGQA